MKKMIVGAAAIAVGLVVATAPIPGLDIRGCRILGIMLWAVLWWIFDILPEYATGLIMGVVMVVGAGVDMEVMFSAFSGSTWWVLVSAFALGVAMTQSGLLTRAAYAVVRVFPDCFGSQLAALIFASTVVSPFIPSMSAKVAVLMPLAEKMGVKLGYAPESRAMTGLFLAILTGVRNAGPLFVSASVLGFLLRGFYPEAVQQCFGGLGWTIAALPWFLFVSAVNYVCIRGIYGRDDSALRLECGLHVLEREFAPAESPSRDERVTAVILVTTLILWMTESLHGIGSELVGILGMSACAAIGVLDRGKFRSDVTWDTLLFTGVVLGLAPVLRETGVDVWLIGLIGPVFRLVADSPYLLVLGVAFSTVAVRFVMVSELAYANVFMAFAVPVAVSLGINPWIVGFVVYAVVSPWFVPYQNPVYLAAYYSVDGRMASHRDCGRYCFLYTAICLGGLLVSVPFWQIMGIYGVT